MRKRLVAGLGLVSLLVAGCGDGGALSSPGATNPPSSAPAPTSEVESQRSGPAKAVSVPDKCSIITEPQQQELGVDQPPREHAYSGRDGCIYQKGELGDVGWGVFVGVNGDSSYSDEVKKRPNPEETEVSGYPVSVYEDSTGCLLYADISDDGFLIANANKNSSEDGGVDVCQQGEKFIEAAVQNLPDA